MLSFLETATSSVATVCWNNGRWEFEDFGDCTLLGDNGATDYFRVDWMNPDGLSTWGDGRLFMIGTKGYMEIRKYVNVANGAGNQIFLVNNQEEKQINANGVTGFPFFGEMILDSLNINPGNFIFHEANQVQTFWENGILANEKVMELIAESVLLYTFAFLGNRLLPDQGNPKRQQQGVLRFQQQKRHRQLYECK